MPSSKLTISVRLDEAAKRRLEKAAQVMKQSTGSFLQVAGEERARQVLLDWALERYRKDEASLSELADSTGLAIEEIMLAQGGQNTREALDAFLKSCRTVAETTGNREFLRHGEEAVKAVERHHSLEQVRTG